MSNIDDLLIDRRNPRLLIETIDESNAIESIVGYADEPIVSLIDACVPLTSIMPKVMNLAVFALHETPSEPLDGLTRNESASIYLYTMDWYDSQESLYKKLNDTLKQANRAQLRPWFKYLKLLMTAVVKLPSIGPRRVWCAVEDNMVKNLTLETRLTWWTISSTTTSFSTLRDHFYLHTNDNQRFFVAIESINGRNIQSHSQYHHSKEIILLPGTQLEVQHLVSPAPHLNIIHLKQIVPDEILLDPPFPDASFYPSNRQSKSARSVLKKFIIWTISVLVLCLIGIVIGYSIMFRYKYRTSDSVIKWNGINWAISCDFPGNDFFDITVPPKTCAAICTQMPRCTHYSWSVSKGGTCWLKKGHISKLNATFVRNPTSICGIVERQQSVESETLSNTENCHFIGNDLFNVQLPSELCRKKCTETSMCTHFVWTIHKNGTCWLKKGEVQRNQIQRIEENRSTICGFVNQTISWNDNGSSSACDFPGNDFLRIRLSSTKCRRKCRLTRLCTHYTWNDGICSMKTGNVSRLDAFATNSSTIICGILSPLEYRV